MATVTIKEMVNAIETLVIFSDGLQAHGHGSVLMKARAARDYILSTESQIAERDEQIAEMREVTGPKCPRCSHWLCAEHNYFGTHSGQDRFECIRCEDAPENPWCMITSADLIENHPEIASELGLTETSDE